MSYSEKLHTLKKGFYKSPTSSLPSKVFLHGTLSDRKTQFKVS